MGTSPPPTPPAPVASEAETLFVCDYCGATMPHQAALPDGWLSTYKTACGTRRTVCDRHDCWVRDGEDSAKASNARPTRLELAKAELEEARTKFDEHMGLAEQWQVTRNNAKAELAAAESEAAAQSLPKALVNTAREIIEGAARGYLGYPDCLEIMAKHHGIDVATLRNAVEAGK